MSHAEAEVWLLRQPFRSDLDCLVEHFIKVMHNTRFVQDERRWYMAGDTDWYAETTSYMLGLLRTFKRTLGLKDATLVKTAEERLRTHPSTSVATRAALPRLAANDT
jgi:hypothetical protein